MTEISPVCLFPKTWRTSNGLLCSWVRVGRLRVENTASCMSNAQGTINLIFQHSMRYRNHYTMWQISKNISRRSVSVVLSNYRPAFLWNDWLNSCVLRAYIFKMLIREEATQLIGHHIKLFYRNLSICSIGFNFSQALWTQNSDPNLETVWVFVVWLYSMISKISSNSKTLIFGFG